LWQKEWLNIVDRFMEKTFNQEMKIETT